MTFSGYRKPVLFRLRIRPHDLVLRLGECLGFAAAVTDRNDAVAFSVRRRVVHIIGVLDLCSDECHNFFSDDDFPVSDSVGAYRTGLLRTFKMRFVLMTASLKIVW